MEKHITNYEGKKVKLMHEFIHDYDSIEIANRDFIGFIVSVVYGVSLEMIKIFINSF